MSQSILHMLAAPLIFLLKFRVKVTKLTTFDNILSQEIPVFQKLKQLGYSKVTLQTGGGDCVPVVSEEIPGLVLEHFQYKPSIKEDIAAADLVISHAGIA